MINLIWIKRVSEKEDSWIKEYLSTIDKRYNIIIVGHTNLDPRVNNFTYIPFWENGLDDLGLICHKKNLGIKNSKDGYCLVLHSDACPKEDFYDIAISKKFDDNTAVCPIGLFHSTRSFTWCNYIEKAAKSGKYLARNKDIDESADEWTYIAGAAIFGTKKFFLRFPWDETLKHGQEEDVELSTRIYNNGGKLLADAELIFNSKTPQ
jgi:hypothetical protein